jgi:hypothetical protein
MQFGTNGGGQSKKLRVEGGRSEGGETCGEGPGQAKRSGQCSGRLYQRPTSGARERRNSAPPPAAEARALGPSNERERSNEREAEIGQQADENGPERAGRVRGGGRGGDGGRETSSTTAAAATAAICGDELKVLYTNAQSIVGKIDELGSVASEVKPDLILVTETWCNAQISDAFLNIQGYEL